MTDGKLAKQFFPLVAPEEADFLGGHFVWAEQMWMTSRPGRRILNSDLLLSTFYWVHSWVVQCENFPMHS
jgi:hypothetical protein